MRPIPTNEWWGNLLAWDGQRESDAVFAGPYTYKVVQGQPGAIGSGLSVSYLLQYRTDGPVNDNGAPRFYFYPPNIKNWIFSAVELAGPPGAAPLLLSRLGTTWGAPCHGRDEDVLGSRIGLHGGGVSGHAGATRHRALHCRH